MSIISNTHALIPFISGKSQPFAGQRLVKVTCKQTDKMTKAGITALPSVCASVPVLLLDDVKQHSDALLPHLLTFLEGTQDAIVRNLYEGSKGARKDVRQEEIDLPACLSFLAAKEAGSRLSGDTIKAWFESGMAQALSEAIIGDALKYGDKEGWSEEQAATVGKHVGVYCDVFQMLAGKSLSRASFGDKQWHRLTQIIGMILEESPEDAFAQRLSDRMAVIAREVPIADMI